MLHNSLVRQDIILRACTVTAFTVAGVWGVAWFYVTRLLVFWILLEEWQFLGKFKATLATTWSVIEGGLQKKKWIWCFHDSIVAAFQGSQSKENEASVKQERFACCAQSLKIPKSTIKKGFFIFRAIVEFNLRVWEYGSPSCLESEPGGDYKSLVGTGMGGDVDEGWGGGGVEEIHTLQPNVTLPKSFLPREIKIATARAQRYRSKQSHGKIGDCAQSNEYKEWPPPISSSQYSRA